MKIYGAAIFAMACWAFSFVWYKVALAYYKPLSLISLRLFFASFILLAVGLLFKKRDIIDKADRKYIFFLAFFEPFLYFLGESFGMQYVSPTVGALIIATIPVFTPFFAYIVIRERVTIPNIIGLIISFVGILILILKKDLSFAAEPIGVALMFFAVFSAIGFGLSAKRLAEKYSSLTLITWQNVIGFFLFLPLFLLFEYDHFIVVQLDFTIVKTIAELTIFPSIIAYLLLIPVIRELGLSKTNVLVNLIPIFTAVFAYFMLNEHFTTQKIVGMGVVIIGLFLSQLKMVSGR